MNLASTHPASETPLTTHEPPRQARRFGAIGLIPFVLGALLVWVVYPDARYDTARGLSAYAAGVVAYLGGIHWGLAMRAGASEPLHLGWSAAPPLVAAIGVLMPPSAGLVVLGVMLIVCYAVDRRLYAAQGQQAWLTLRFRLSAVASLCCFIGAAAVPSGA